MNFSSILIGWRWGTRTILLGWVKKLLPCLLWVRMVQCDGALAAWEVISINFQDGCGGRIRTIRMGGNS